MAKYTKERTELHKKLIHELTVRQPNITAVGAQDLMRKQGHELDEHYVGKLMRQIDAERAQQADELLLKAFLVQFMERTRLADTHLWNILSSKKSKDSDRISAARELRNNFKEVFEKMFDAGMFKRKLGSYEVTNMGEILDIAEQIENEHSRETEEGDDSEGDSGSA